MVVDCRKVGIWHWHRSAQNVDVDKHGRHAAPGHILKKGVVTLDYSVSKDISSISTRALQYFCLVEGRAAGLQAFCIFSFLMAYIFLDWEVGVRTAHQTIAADTDKESSVLILPFPPFIPKNSRIPGG